MVPTDRTVVDTALDMDPDMDMDPDTDMDMATTNRLGSPA